MLSGEAVHSLVTSENGVIECQKRDAIAARISRLKLSDGEEQMVGEMVQATELTCSQVRNCGECPAAAKLWSDVVRNTSP